MEVAYVRLSFYILIQSTSSRSVLVTTFSYRRVQGSFLQLFMCELIWITLMDCCEYFFLFGIHTKLNHVIVGISEEKEELQKYSFFLNHAPQDVLQTLLCVFQNVN